MQESVHVPIAPREMAGARDMQAQLYREIGISAVAAALHSISKPEPGKSPAPSVAIPPTTGHAANRAA